MRPALRARAPPPSRAPSGFRSRAPLRRRRDRRMSGERRARRREARGIVDVPAAGVRIDRAQESPEYLPGPQLDESIDALGRADTHRLVPPHAREELGLERRTD